MSLLAGSRIGHYEIVAPLGAGGMGEVYLADDTRLGRRVALKLLPRELAAEASARQRFTQEARTASALNHPHIVGIFEIGRDGDHDFIVMEYIEGDTLRAIVARGRVELKRAIDLIAQAASGLAAAHDADIVHRDIKPENLIVTRTNHLKILDFGLAKLTEDRRAALATEAVTGTATPALTRVGTIVGTAAYMSPEQAQSQPLDGRTDIFSLGAVLYELLTGTQAFGSKSAIDTLHAVINRDPLAEPAHERRLPTEIVDILAKSLAKDPVDRYHDAADFALDLRRLKRRLEAGSRASELSASDRRARWVLPLAVAAATALTAILVLVLARPAAAPPNDSPFQQLTLSPLTGDPGYEGEPTFSPDGETIAYVSDRTGNLELFLRQVSGGPDVNITNNPADDLQPSFSPDGRQLVFVSTRSGSSEVHFYGQNVPAKGGDIWVMSTLGGNARRIAQAGNFPSWSPDGSQVLYSSGPWFGGKLYSVPSGGGTPREIPITFSGVTPAHLVYPKYSDDGRWILFATPDDIGVVAAEGGQARIVEHGQTPVWGAGSRSVIYSNTEAGRNLSLWTVPFDAASGQVSGAAHPLTVGRGADQHPAASRDGKRIAFSAIDVSTSIEVQPFDSDSGRFTGGPRLLTDTHDLIYFFDINRDATAALFNLHRGPAMGVGRAEAAMLPVQLTHDSAFEDSNPLWSPDGGTIAFSRRSVKEVGSTYSLWVMAADGGNPQQVIEKMGLNNLFTWMPDGKSLIHVGPNRQLYLLDLASKTERQLTNEAGVMPVVTTSADGRWVVYQCVVGDTVDLHAISPEDGAVARAVVTTPAQDYHPSISPSGRWLYYYPDHKDLYRVPGPAQNWLSAAPVRVTNWQMTSISFAENPQLSRDGRQLAYSRGRIRGDIWLLSREQ